MSRDFLSPIKIPHGAKSGWGFISDGNGNGTWKAIPAAVFGDGSDGATTCDGASAVPGMSRSGSTYTLTRDVYFTDLTVNAGVTVIGAGYIIYGTGTLTVNATGTIHNNGSNGSGSTGGAGGLAGYFNAGANGGNSSLGGTSQASDSPSVGGGGGSDGSTHAGGSVTTPIGGVHRDVIRWLGASFATGGNRYSLLYGGAGGGAGSGSSGGGGGGVLAVIFRTIVNNGAIQARGGNAAGTNAGGGGGGGLLIGTTNLTGSGTQDANGGTKVGTGVNGTAGTYALALAS